MKNFDLEKTYIVNTAYKFRSDVNRIILTNEDSGLFYTSDPKNIENTLTGFAWILHPLLVYIFSYFDGEKNLKDTINEISISSDIDTSILLESISRYINNADTLYFQIPLKNIKDGEMFDKVFALPKNFLIEKPENYRYRDLLKGIDFSTIPNHTDFTMRHNIPNEVSLMVTEKCLTDCIYCYADRSKKIKKSEQLSFQRIKELIQEARSLNLRNFDVGGGDFFMYENWFELTKELLKNDYMPYISTKVPIQEDDILKLKELKITNMQFSLDSVNIEELKTMLKVNDSYLEKVNNTLLLLEKYNIKLYVKSVITKYNDSLTSVEKLINYLVSFKNIHKISIAPGEYSNYKPFTYASSSKNLDRIREYVENINNQFSNISIEMQGYQAFSEEDVDQEIKKKAFEQRSLCSGNTTNFYILPEGTATICEQIYWHPNLKLGSVKENSIMEVWNSDKAKGLFNITQDEIQPSSPCYTCDEFEECRRGKGACWRDAFFTYGDSNFDYPSPNCPYAPVPEKNTFIK